MNDNIFSYINELISDAPEVIKEIERNNLVGSNIYPIIGREAGRFLYSFILANQPKTILELGTGCGYATIFMALAAKQYGGKVVSVDCNKEMIDVAKDNVLKAACIDSVELQVEDAHNYVLKSQSQFDLILQDTYPALYSVMLDDCIKLLTKHRCLITHDALVEPLNAPKKMVDDMNDFNRLLMQHKKLQSSIIPVNDGLWLSVKNQL